MKMNRIMFISKTLIDLLMIKQSIKMKYFCMKCFSSEEVLTNHPEFCLEIIEKQAVKMPKNIKLGDYQKQL